MIVTNIFGALREATTKRIHLICLALDPARFVCDLRINCYRHEIFASGGMCAEPGLSWNTKWEHYVKLKRRPWRTSLLFMKSSEWNPILNELDEIRRRKGDEGVVLHINKVISNEPLF